ncbi:hypothetical protein KP79_PYT08184 [Mizuhopecten yessoensis]|uniref:Uncharacterized protein n=1 Tax=Mizuhopecten yessoensis TaxID=6573 RepID=A0A210QF82_MIZYE|nr:hypothetical protein KP79_PYT08184 [Mizuhopecten yessoensis]
MFRFVHQFKSSSFLDDDDSCDDNFVRMAARGIHDDEFKTFMTMNVPHEDEYDRHLYTSSGHRFAKSLDENLMKTLKKACKPERPSLTICTCDNDVRGVLRVCRCSRSQNEFIPSVTSKSLLKSDFEDNDRSKNLSVTGHAIPIKDSKRRAWSVDDVVLQLNRRK